MKNATLRRVGNLFAGADAGFYGMPAAVEEARAAVARVQAEAERANAQAAAVTGYDLVDSIVVAAAKPAGKFPSLGAIAAAEQTRQAQDIYSRAVASAVERVEDQLEYAVVGSADICVVEHLRPALAEVMAELAEIGTLLKGTTSHAALLTAPEPVRQARIRLDQVAVRYVAIRAAQSALGALREDPGDGGKFLELRNASALLAGYTPGRFPWPPDSLVGKLMWFANPANDAEVWCPTSEERKAQHVAEVLVYQQKRGRVDPSLVAN